MKAFADLHVHSKYSGGTSKHMSPSLMVREGKKKGINLIGSGDILHPQWLNDITQLEYNGEGFYHLDGTYLPLTVEVEDERRVHHLIIFPEKEKVLEFREAVASRSSNIDADGRPKLRMSGAEIAELAHEAEALVGPCHAFTPWTAMYAYHNSIKECYGDAVKYVSFLELGLSADSDYADRIEEIRHLTYLTNSDAHSPYPNRLGREFNVIEMDDMSFESLKKAITDTSEKRFVLNVGLPPEEGKYNRTACTRCYEKYTLQEAIMRKWRCSCGGLIKRGVSDRVNELSDYENPEHPQHRPEYLHLIPLMEIIAKVVGQGVYTKRVRETWEALIKKYGTEINVLIYGNLDGIEDERLRRAVHRFRAGKVKLSPGGGGKYGEIIVDSLYEDIEEPAYEMKNGKTLFDY